MADPTPNAAQIELIEHTQGILLADAGPGTGKTFTIALRYDNILKREKVEPEDILVITFTNNAAENMKERIILRCGRDPAELRDAPISTFHSLCHTILNQHGIDAPACLGMEESISPSTRILENDILELGEFRRFMQEFISTHDEYEDLYRVLYDPGDLLRLIRSLCAKGIFSERNGWYRNSEDYLDGDYRGFKEIFDELNEPLQGVKGPRNSKLRTALNSYGNKCYPPDAPDKSEVRGSGKSVPDRWAREAFCEDRGELKRFVHDVYFEYAEYALSRNYLNFGFILMFAFALLCENDALRRRLDYRYVMIDEFQDTNEIQFKLALLLCRSGNLCAVGDWKQSIYGFQYASVDNIIRFRERVERYKEELNGDRLRITYPVTSVRDISLVENYRSSQTIIDLSQTALKVKFTRNDEVDAERVEEKLTGLFAVRTGVPSRIGAYVARDQYDCVLWIISELVGKEEVADRGSGDGEGGANRKIRADDIAVLVRKRKFGLELLNRAREYDMPAAYEGGVELFRTEPALLLLAWLRILKDRRSRRGWAVVLERAGYTLDEIRHLFSPAVPFPRDMLSFLKELIGEKRRTVGTAARLVFRRYGLDNGYTEKLIEVLQGNFENSFMNTGDVITFIEDNIESGATYEVDAGGGENVFKIQTIHASKGLEYPVVIIPDAWNIGGGSSPIGYWEPAGLRQKKIFSEEGVEYPHVYDNWRMGVMAPCLKEDRDEERRLLYVAVTRAESHLFFTSESGNENRYFRNLVMDKEEVIPEIIPPEIEPEERRSFRTELPGEPAPVKVSCHYLMDDMEPTRDEKNRGRGTEYGIKVHLFAERYAAGQDVEPGDRDEENVKALIDGLSGKLIPERECFLSTRVRRRRVLFRGIIDLVHIHGDTMEIIDYKTDLDPETRKEYGKQISIYYHIVKGQYPEKKVKASLFYTATGTLVKIEPLSLEEIRELAERKIRADFGRVCGEGGGGVETEL